jgi:hypothetical protein
MSACDHVALRPISDITLPKVLETADGGDVTALGMGSSFRDCTAEQTTSLDEVVEVALAHTINNKVEAAYRRTNYLERRRGLLMPRRHSLPPCSPL